MAGFDIQTKRSLVISLIVILSLLPSNTEGIRLDKGISSNHKKVHESDVVLLKTNNNDVGGIMLCKNGHCITGNNRKLITETTTSSTNSIKNMKNEDSNQKSTLGEEKVSRNSLPNSENQEAPQHTSENNEEIVDEMDYSPASRKPPIHN